MITLEVSPRVPSCDPSRLIGPALWALGALIIVGLSACAESPPLARLCPTDDDPNALCGASPDGGPAVQDASGPGTDAGDTPDPISDGGVSEADAATPGVERCANGLDDDDNQAIDCSDPSCSAEPYCCVGSGAAECCMPAEAELVEFSACSELLCGDVSALFGTPSLEADAMLPDAEADSGLVFGAPVSPNTERLTVTAIIDSPGPCTGCVDAVVVALGAAPDAGARVVPDVALMVRRGYGDIALLVGGEVLDTAALEAGPHHYTMLSEPEGGLSVQVRPAATPTATPTETLVGDWSPTPDARVMLYGRTPADAVANSATRALSLQVDRSQCDLPGALQRRSALELGSLGSSVSVVQTPSGWLMAYAVDGAVTLASASSAAGPWTPTGADISDGPHTLLDPELAIEGGQLSLFVTRTDPQGRMSLGSTSRAITDSDFGPIAAVSLAPVVDGVELSEPSVISFGGRRLLAATRTTETATSNVLYEELDGTFTRMGGSALEAAIALEGESLAEFDDDGVGDPELVALPGDVLGLYYAGRRGTRTAIGLRVSANERTFRDVGDELLRGSGSGADALGVSAPCVVVEDDRMHLYYRAWDGSTTSLGRAERSL